MTRFNPDYKKYEYEYDMEDLLQVLFDKQCLEEALEEDRNPNSYKTELLFTDNNNILMTIYYYYAGENKENNREIGEEI